MSSKIIIGEYVKLITPKFAKVFGQGEQLKAMKIKINGLLYLLPFGGLFKISTKCDPENKIANMDTKPYPLIHKSFVEKNISIFQKIKKE